MKIEMSKEEWNEIQNLITLLVITTTVPDTVLKLHNLISEEVKNDGTV